MADRGSKLVKRFVVGNQSVVAGAVSSKEGGYSSGELLTLLPHPLPRVGLSDTRYVTLADAGIVRIDPRGSDSWCRGKGLAKETIVVHFNPEESMV
jgi:hypothetical protein